MLAISRRYRHTRYRGWRAARRSLAACCANAIRRFRVMDYSRAACRAMGLLLSGAAALLVSAAVARSPARADDWPTYQHDVRRSGVTAEALDVDALEAAWVWRSPRPPQPAWHGPAKWDAYAGIRGLRSMRNYDPVFHVIAVGESVYFGSSVDDAVRCLDAATGRERWIHVTEGPIRVAPSYSDGAVYVGSDDGHAYCLDAAQGELRWRYRPDIDDEELADQRHLIVNDGRLIGFWPCRTGVLVDGGTAYFACSLLPWKTSYLCALDAISGRPEGEGRFVLSKSGLTLEGPLLASDEQLFVPQGRLAPRVFRRRGGETLGQLKGGGGTFVVLTDDDEVLYGPGNKTGAIQQSDRERRTTIATYDGANAMVVAHGAAYLLTDEALSSIDRGDRSERWKVACDCPYALIMAGEVLFAGGTDQVAAYSTADGTRLWSAAIEGRAYGLAAAGGQLLVSTDVGHIYAFRAGGAGGAGGAVPEGDKTNDSAGASIAAAADRPLPARDPAPLESPYDAAANPLLAWGPELEFVDPQTAVVRWATRGPSPTRLEYGLGEWSERIDDATLRTEHEVRLEGLKTRRVYWYQVAAEVDDRHASTERLECDTCFNLTLPTVPAGPSPYLAEDGDEPAGGAERTAERAAKAAAMAEYLLDQGIDRQGLCFLLHDDEGRLAYELARRTRLRIVVFENNQSRAQAARKALLEAGLYGWRVAVRHVDALDRLPVTGQCANVVIVPTGLSGGWPRATTAAEVERVLRPAGVALVGWSMVPRLALEDQRLTGRPAEIGPDGRPNRDLPAGWLAADGVKGHVLEHGTGAWVRIERDQPSGAGVWSHQYGLPDNSAYGGETLGGATAARQFEVQWIGQPGPRFQPDRNGRKPAPLAVGGRLFVQGLGRVAALDAYNGSVLWTRELPRLARFNLPRDSSNWCADTDAVYLAIGDGCCQLHAASGQVIARHPVVRGPRDDWDYEWGYVARVGGLLLGSAVKAGSAHVNFWGGANEGWYDATSGEATFKVTSDNLFALDATASGDGAVVWKYQAAGVIQNATITATDETIYFVESRHPAVRASEARRLGLAELWQEAFLVALDLASGTPRWQVPLDVAAGEVVAYLAHGEESLVLVTSGGKQYHAYAFEPASGAARWEQHFDWPSDNHGGHMARPAIVGGAVYVRPEVLELADGAHRDVKLPKGGCGTYACTQGALLFRASTVTLWDAQSGRLSRWDRLRPDCWLSTIPAGGLILSPEGGGGCSCGGWLETSVAFIPRGEGAGAAAP